MFREVAIVTFTAGMLGTSAATLTNTGYRTEDPPAPPAIERPATEPAQTVEPKRKPKRNVVALDVPSFRE
jgi:hypothetical protein